MTRVLVCGGRSYGVVPSGCPSDPNHEARASASREARLLETTLDALHVDRRISVVIDGGANGADMLARWWAKRMLIPQLTFTADWKAHGRAAGPIRNRRMLEEGKPDLVVAFPGGSGTANMVRQARAAGVEVVEVQG